MKNGFFLLICLGLLLGSCAKDVNQFEVDTQIILDYIAQNNLDAQQHPSGLHYVITKEGTGDAHPTLFSEVQVEYKGYFTDGTVFDQTSPNDPITFALSQVIVGWQEGIPVFKKDGEGILLIPSGLAYGTFGQGSVPPNTVLIFDIKLHDFN